MSGALYAAAHQSQSGFSFVSWNGKNPVKRILYGMPVQGPNQTLHDGVPGLILILRILLLDSKKQNKTKQNKTKQNKTKQNKTKQNKVAKEITCLTKLSGNTTPFLHFVNYN